MLLISILSNLSDINLVLLVVYLEAKLVVLGSTVVYYVDIVVYCLNLLARCFVS